MLQLKFELLGHTFSVFEMVMLVCFGSSWPFAISKTYKAKSVKGKSILFLSLIFIGYIAGIIHKVLYAMDVVLALYILNGILVATEICLYFMYKDNDSVATVAPVVELKAVPQEEKQEDCGCGCGCK
ncbi:MAG: hypothetical protein WCK67_03030 [bacterium]